MLPVLSSATTPVALTSPAAQGRRFGERFNQCTMSIRQLQLGARFRHAVPLSASSEEQLCNVMRQSRDVESLLLIF
jgi:hypothetical protein